MNNVTFVVPRPRSAEELYKPYFADEQGTARTVRQVLRNPMITEGGVGVRIFELEPVGGNGHFRPVSMPVLAMECIKISRVLRVLEVKSATEKLEQCRPMSAGEIAACLPAVMDALKVMGDILYGAAKRDGSGILERL
ncbi:MAG TPA: hypothetical protein VL944_02710 [Candidatus Acidoferrum sp.]|nr:hypothetical protein [Candidatus Acidoferrum sp.]